MDNSFSRGLFYACDFRLSIKLAVMKPNLIGIFTTAGRVGDHSHLALARDGLSFLGTIGFYAREAGNGNTAINCEDHLTSGCAVWLGCVGRRNVGALMAVFNQFDQTGGFFHGDDSAGRHRPLIDSNSSAARHLVHFQAALSG